MDFFKEIVLDEIENVQFSLYYEPLGYQCSNIYGCRIR